MDELKEKQKPEKKETVTTIVEVKKRKTNPYVIMGIIAIVAVVAIGIAFHSHNKNKELLEELKAVTDEAERQKQLAADLEAYSNGQETELQKWKKQAEDLLNIQETDPIITRQQIEEQLEALSELVTQKYMYTNADQSENNKTWIFNWDMPFSEKSFIVKYDGIIKAGIDLSSIKIDVDEENRAITVTLPASKITDHNVPQDKIEIFNVKDGFLNKVDPRACLKKRGSSAKSTK